MRVKLPPGMLEALGFFYQEHIGDVRNDTSKDIWGFAYSELDKPLLDAGFIAISVVGPESDGCEQRSYITQAGADYLGKNIKIVTPFDTDELTAARAEIARLTAALAESEQARKVADAGWAECMEEVDNLLREIDILKTDSGIPF